MTQTATASSKSRVSAVRGRVSESPFLRHLVVAIACLAAVIVVLESVSDFRSTQLTTMAYTGIAAGGLTVLTGLNGQLSLGHGALMAIGAYATAVLLETEQVPLPFVLLGALLVTLVIGAAIGVAAARLHGPYIAGATLALAIAVPGIPLYYTNTLGGEQGLTVLVPETPVWVEDVAYFVTANEITGSKYIGYIGWLCLIAVFVLLANLKTSRTGRNWRAVRDDEVAAEIAGINLAKARVSAFVVSAACAGLAGAVMAMAVRVTAPSGFTLALSLSLLTAVVLGGLGSLVGALIGAALLTFLPQAVTSVGLDAGLTSLQAAELAPLVYGLTLVLVILLAPAGIVGSVANAWRSRKARKDTERTTAPTSSSRGPDDQPGGEQ